MHNRTYGCFSLSLLSYTVLIVAQGHFFQTVVSCIFFSHEITRLFVCAVFAVFGLTEYCWGTVPLCDTIIKCSLSNWNISVPNKNFPCQNEIFPYQNKYRPCQYEFLSIPKWKFSALKWLFFYTYWIFFLQNETNLYQNHILIFQSKLLLKMEFFFGSGGGRGRGNSGNAQKNAFFSQENVPNRVNCMTFCTAKFLLWSL